MLMENKNGITLIALIITIIVMLILSEIAISSVVGENGVLNQAKDAKIANQKGAAQEMIGTAWNACEADYNVDITISRGRYYTVENLNKYLKNTGVVTELNYNENGTSTLKYTTYSDKNQYEIQISNSGKIDVVGDIVTLYEIPEPSLLDKVNSNKSEYYGKKVSGYTVNGISNWRIFYSDSERVYLITTDYLPVNKIPNSLGMETSSEFATWWTSYPVTTVNNNYSRFLFSGMVSVNSNNRNYKASASLLDCSKWTAFVDSNKADYAIGSPTIEMWSKSWNAKFNDTLMVTSNEVGYIIGKTNDGLNYTVDLTSTSGYQIEEANNMYYPHKVVYSGCYGYWLASPSAYIEYGVGFVDYRGYDLEINNNYASYALRPVVSLLHNVKTSSLESDEVIILEN